MLLDELSIPRAHVLGWSLGSVVAQSSRYTYPHQVASLVLYGTWARCDPFMRALMTTLKYPWETGDVATALVTLGVVYSPEFLESAEFEKFVAWTTPLAPTTPEQIRTVAEQWAADLDFDSLDRIEAITVPTLVLTGEATSSPPHGRRRRTHPGGMFELKTASVQATAAVRADGRLPAHRPHVPRAGTRSRLIDRQLIDLVADVLARFRAGLVHQLELGALPAGLRIGIALGCVLFELLGSSSVTCRDAVLLRAPCSWRFRFRSVSIKSRFRRSSSGCRVDGVARARGARASSRIAVLYTPIRIGFVAVAGSSKVFSKSSEHPDARFDARNTANGGAQTGTEDHERHDQKASAPAIAAMTPTMPRTPPDDGTQGDGLCRTRPLDEHELARQSAGRPVVVLGTVDTVISSPSMPVLERFPSPPAASPGVPNRR